jgi:aminopeptidase I
MPPQTEAQIPDSPSFQTFNDRQEATLSGPSEVDIKAYTTPFLDFISANPTVFHAVDHFAKRLVSHGFTKLSDRESWTSRLSGGGKYFLERNGSSLIAFVVGDDYKSGNGASIIASHVDALTARLKPIPKLSTKAGYVQLGIAPYAGALNTTWWDRDLGIGGRVVVKDSKTGKIQSKLVKLGWPIARIPTLAPHFGAAADLSHPNQETQMVPIIGLDNTDLNGQQREPESTSSVLGGAGAFTATQPERLVKAIAGELNIRDCNINSELFSTGRSLMFCR